MLWVYTVTGKGGEDAQCAVGDQSRYYEEKSGKLEMVYLLGYDRSDASTPVHSATSKQKMAMLASALALTHVLDDDLCTCVAGGRRFSFRID